MIRLQINNRSETFPNKGLNGGIYLETLFEYGTRLNFDGELLELVNLLIEGPVDKGLPLDGPAVTHQKL